MRLSPEIEQFGTERPVKPTSQWRMTAQAEERVTQTAHETFYYRVLAWLLLITGFVFELVYARNPRDAESAFILAAKAYLLIVSSQLILHFLYRRLTDHLYLGPGLRRIQAKVPDDRACPVHIRIKQSGVVTGCDEGYMWFEEGSLYFKGLQSVFRLNREDVLPLKQWPKGMRPNPDHGRLPQHIVLDSDEYPMVIDISLIDPFEDFNTRRRAHFFQLEVMEWLVQRPSGALESLLPPRQVHPGLHRPDFTRNELIIGSGGLIGINAILLLTTKPTFSVSSVQGFFAALALVLTCWLLYRAVRLALHTLKTTRIRQELSSPPDPLPTPPELS